jgi:thiol-disulfide isomerase/thioredoxin
VSSRSKPRERQQLKKKGFSRNEKVAGLVILFIAIWAVYSFSQPSAPSTTTTIGTTSGTSSGLDFTLPEVGQNGLTGQWISLSQFRGKVVFLEFMEPWCPHCQSMMPTLERLYQEFGPQNVVFLTVAGPWETTADDTAKFIRDYNSRLTYVYDSSGTVFNMFGVNSTPTFFIIGKNGEILQTYNGEVAYDTFAADLNRFKT